MGGVAWRNRRRFDEIVKDIDKKKAFIQLFKSTRSSCLVRIEFLNLNRFKRVNSSWFQLKAFR